MLTMKDIEQMILELVLKRPPSLRTPEADAMRAQLAQEIAEAESRGSHIHIASPD